MKRTGGKFGIRKERDVQSLALGVLLVMGGLAIAGPSGLLSWSENLRLLDQRQAHLAALTKERDALRNRVALLDPDSADPDMVGELLRSQLNVVHPDEVVIRLDDEDAR
jgi:cell division protein FtsB